VTYFTSEIVAVTIDTYGNNGCFDAKWLTVTECEAVTMVYLDTVRCGQFSTILTFT
jgi:hypothetical protein